MKNERPAVGSVVTVSVNNEDFRTVEIAGYFDKTRSVFLYEEHFTPLVAEWDDVRWEESPLNEMETDIKCWEGMSDVPCDLSEWLVNKGWKKY